MKTAYAYSTKGTCQRTQLAIEARCIFFDGRTAVGELALFDELESALKQTVTLPDCVVVLADPETIQAIYGLWSSATNARQRFLDRGAKQGVQFVKAYYFVAWGADGLRIHGSTPGTGVDEIPWKVKTEDFVAQGLLNLVSSNPVVQIAPAGHVFKHPSGTINKVFIQARELSTSEAQLVFVGRSLCLFTNHDLFRDAVDVYIDTMSIYPFVREALDFTSSRARIHSFHSYESLSDMTPPEQPYMVIVSASTSGGMAKRLHTAQGFDQGRLLTLIDVTAQERTGTILISLENVNEDYRLQVASGSETEIELVGEHFSSKSKPPRFVTLGIPHAPKNLAAVLSEFALQNIQPINDVPIGKTRPTVVSLNGVAISDRPNFQAWFDAEISWHISVAVDAIVHTDDEGSARLARLASELISTNKGSAPTIISYSELMVQRLDGKKGVLVVTAVAGDGGLLREISRDLRELIPTTLPRHFVVAVGLPQSTEAWERLRQFLIRNSTSRQYGFSSWLVLPVGPDGSTSAWSEMSLLASAAEVDFPRRGLVADDLADASLALAVSAINTSYQKVLPQTNGTELGLSEGFLFFGNAFAGRLQEVTVSATYLTVAAVLQAARDLKSAESQLRPNGYESVVLAPENFLRFNDSLLQACILRAALAAELDYSSSPHLSTIMKELLLKIFERHGHPYGAAALEFAAALATRRLKLKKEDTDELVEKIAKQLEQSQTPSPLLGLLLMTK